MSAPVSGEQLLAAAVAAEDDGDREGAIGLLRRLLGTSEILPDQRRSGAYLLGTRLVEAGRAEEAAAVLSPEAGNGNADALQTRIEAAYALALGRTGGRDAAAAVAWAKVLERPGLPPGIALEGYTEVARLARRAGNDRALADALAGEVAVQDESGARYELAAVRRRLGDGAGAAAALLEVVQRSPESRYALLAISELRKDGVAVEPGDEGLVAYRHRQYADAIAVLGPSVNDPGASAEVRARRGFYYAAALEDSDNLALAVAAYDAVSVLAPSSLFAHRAKYWAARTVERLGDAPGAAARYVALARDGPPGEFSSEASFRSGYVLFQAGQVAAAVAAWGPAAGDARSLFWEGLGQASLGDSLSARATWTRVATTWPLDFYGLEAARRLNAGPPPGGRYVRSVPEPGPDWRSLEAWLAAIAGPPAGPVAPTDAAALAKLGLREEAESVLLAAARGADAWAVYQRVREASEAGLASAAARLADRLRLLTSADGQEVPIALERLIYPRSYVAQLDDAGRREGVDPLLLAALVEQESLWDSRATSGAGALGLMQVMPETGASIASTLHVTDFSSDDLLKASVSIRFGAYYFAMQLRRFGDPYTALAAYNGGPENAAKWKAAAGPTPVDFLASVEFPETQEYVQRVMEHYAHYQRAYN